MHSRFIRSTLAIAVAAGVQPALTQAQADPSLVLEEVIVTAQTPLLDKRQTGTSTTFTKTEIEKVPQARDPWSVIATESMPSSLHLAKSFFGATAPSRSEYCVCKCRCVNPLPAIPASPSLKKIRIA